MKSLLWKYTLVYRVILYYLFNIFKELVYRYAIYCDTHILFFWFYFSAKDTKVKIYIGCLLICLWWLQDEDDSDAETYGEENEEQGNYSKRKIVSNWDRYQDTEKEVDNESGESQRGTDFSVLLSSAGMHSNCLHTG